MTMKKIEADSEAESFVEEDWKDPEQGEVPKWTEPDLTIPAGTRSGNRKRTGMRYNRYGDDFLIDKEIFGDVDKYFCPGSGGRTYPHRKFDNKETQGSERNGHEFQIKTGG